MILSLVKFGIGFIIRPHSSQRVIMKQLKTTLLATLLSLGVSLGAGSALANSPTAQSPDFSAIQAVQLQNQLPAKNIPYYVRNDEGERRLIAGMVLNTVARTVDTGGYYEMMTWTGGQGAGLPLHRYPESHQAFYVLEGTVEFWLDGKRYLLGAGDYASIPPKTDMAFNFKNHRNKVLIWATGGDVYRAMSAMGEPFDGHVQPETAKVGLTTSDTAKASQTGAIVWRGKPKATKITKAGKTLPDGVKPYVLASGEGERYLAGDQLFIYLGNAKTSNGQFLALITEGPKGEFVPPHFHAEHTEIFYPVIGRVNMIGNQETLQAYPHDSVHIPAGTIHSYQMADHYTKFIGFLTPAVFDGFFRTLGDPYDGYVYPQKPGKLRFDRVLERIDEMDLHLAKPDQKPAE